MVLLREIIRRRRGYRYYLFYEESGYVQEGKRVEDDILIELHYVPLKFIFLLLETIEPIIDAEKWGINNSTGLDSLWGEKLCTYQKKQKIIKFY